jgi:hypothetical protein
MTERTGPNLQNIPIGTPEGKRLDEQVKKQIRGYFFSPDLGFYDASTPLWDYAQVETEILDRMKMDRLGQHRYAETLRDRDENPISPTCAQCGRAKDWCEGIKDTEAP